MSVDHDVALEPQRIGDMRRRLNEHRARLNRLIVQGLPTQLMEDSLRRLEAALQALQEHRCSPAAHRRALPEPGLPLAAAQE